MATAASDAAADACAAATAAASRHHRHLGGNSGRRTDFLLQVRKGKNVQEGLCGGHALGRDGLTSAACFACSVMEGVLQQANERLSAVERGRKAVPRNRA